MTRDFKYSILFVTLFLGLVSCDVMDNQKLTVYNDTSDTLFCFWDTDEHLFWTGNNLLNSVMQIRGRDTTWTAWNCFMLPKSQSVFSDYNWKRSISDSKTQKLYIKFYLTRSFYHKDEVMKDVIKPDTSLSYSFDELQELNWAVHFADTTTGR